MSDYPIHPTGVFVDTKTNEVVAEKPEEGVQLVAPGGEFTPDAKKDIELAGANPADFAPATPNEVRESEDLAPVVEPETVEEPEAPKGK